jgi:hypothetical protein
MPELSRPEPFRISEDSYIRGSAYPRTFRVTIGLYFLLFIIVYYLSPFSSFVSYLILFIMTPLLFRVLIYSHPSGDPYPFLFGSPAR